MLFNSLLFIIYQDSKASVYQPFAFKDVSALIMSPQLPQSAAWQIRDHLKLGRSHVIFQNFNMGILVKYLQDLQLHELRVEFKDSLAMTIDRKALKFEFTEIQRGKQKETNSGLVNCAMQGYLYRRRAGLFSLFGNGTWDSHFFVLTNVGLLIFEGDNFVKPDRLVPLAGLVCER